MLDANTIRLEHAVFQAFSTLLTLANWRINRNLRGMRWFFFYNLVLLAGTTLAFFRYRLSPLYSVVLSNLLFATGYFVLFIVVTELLRRGRRQACFQLGLLLLGIVAMLRYGYFAPDLQKRIVAFSVVVGLQQLHGAFLLRPRRRTAIGDSGAPLAGMLGCLAAGNVVRVLVALSPNGTIMAWPAASVFSVIEIVNTCLQSGTIVAYLWITASMLRRDLEVQATTDPLTGLLNRRAFERLALQHLRRLPEKSAMSAAVLTLDLDGFKQVNDAEGHTVGDEVLIRVASCLRARLSGQDLAARLGGDEFALFLSHTTPEQAAALALDVCHAIATVMLPGQQRTAGVSASMGLSLLELPLGDWESVLTGCDHALYAAKRAGGNRVVTVSQTPSELRPLPSLTPETVHSTAF